MKVNRILSFGGRKQRKIGCLSLSALERGLFKVTGDGSGSNLGYRDKFLNLVLFSLSHAPACPLLTQTLATIPLSLN